MGRRAGQYLGMVAVACFVVVAASAQESGDPPDPAREALRQLVSRLAVDELDTTSDAVTDYEASVFMPHLGAVVMVQHIEGDYGVLVASHAAGLPYAYGRAGLSVALEAGDKATVRLFEGAHLGLKLKPGEDGEGLVFGLMLVSHAEDAGLVLRLADLLEGVLRKAEKVTYEVQGTSAIAVCHTARGVKVSAEFDIADAKKPRVTLVSFAMDGKPVLVCHVTYLSGKPVRALTGLTDRDLTAQGLAVKTITLRELSMSLAVPPPKFFDEPAHRAAGKQLLAAFPVDADALKAQQQREFDAVGRLLEDEDVNVRAKAVDRLGPCATSEDEVVRAGGLKLIDRALDDSASAVRVKALDAFAHYYHKDEALDHTRYLRKLCAMMDRAGEEQEIKTLARLIGGLSKGKFDAGEPRDTAGKVVLGEAQRAWWKANATEVKRKALAWAREAGHVDRAE